MLSPIFDEVFLVVQIGLAVGLAGGITTVVTGNMLITIDKTLREHHPHVWEKLEGRSSWFWNDTLRYSPADLVGTGLDSRFVRVVRIHEVASTTMAVGAVVCALPLVALAFFS